MRVATASPSRGKPTRLKSSLATDARSEWVLSIQGSAKRDRQQAEAQYQAVHRAIEGWPGRVLNRCPTPPFEVNWVPQEGQVFIDPEP